MNRTRLVAMFFLLASVGSGSNLYGAPDSKDQLLAFINVNVVSMISERAMADQTVLIRGDRIESIQPSTTAEVPDNATRIPGRDKYLMPGLADMHVNFIGEEDHLALFIANGVTTVRNMFGSPKELDWRKRVKDGSLFGPTIYTTGPITDGDPPYRPGSAVVTTQKEAEEEVATQKEAGYDGMKVLDNLQPEVYQTILSTVTKLGFPVYGHVPVRVGMERALGMGQESFEHMNDFLYALIPSDARPASAFLKPLQTRPR